MEEKNQYRLAAMYEKLFRNMYDELSLELLNIGYFDLIMRCICDSIAKFFYITCKDDIGKFNLTLKILNVVSGHHVSVIFDYSEDGDHNIVITEEENYHKYFECMNREKMTKVFYYNKDLESYIKEFISDKFINIDHILMHYIMGYVLDGIISYAKEVSVYDRNWSVELEGIYKMEIDRMFDRGCGEDYTYTFTVDKALLPEIN